MIGVYPGRFSVATEKWVKSWQICCRVFLDVVRLMCGYLMYGVATAGAMPQELSGFGPELFGTHLIEGIAWTGQIADLDLGLS